MTLKQIERIKGYLAVANTAIFDAESVLAWNDPKRHEIYVARARLGDVREKVRGWEIDVTMEEARNE